LFALNGEAVGDTVALRLAAHPAMQLIGVYVSLLHSDYKIPLGQSTEDACGR